MKKLVLLIIIIIYGCKDGVVDPKIISDGELVLFYGFNSQSDSTSIFTMYTDGSQQKLIKKSYRKYPAWYEYPLEIITTNRIIDTLQSRYQYNLERLNISDSPKETQILKFDINENISFLKYSQIMNSVLCSYYENGISRIGRIDLNTLNLIKISNQTFDERNPICNQIDDWVYFSTKRNTNYDIYRVRKDGSEYQPVYVDEDYDLTTFSISIDGSLLVTSRYNNVDSYLTVFDISKKTVVANIDVSEFGRALYPSFTKDSKRILYVNGLPDNYEIARNIHIMNVDGSNYKKLTFYNDMILARPLTW